MRALEYRFSPLRWLAAGHLPARAPGLAVRCSGVRLRDGPAPEAPGEDWVRLRVGLAGICGTDTSMLRGRTGPQLSPFVSFPAVLGHEVVGVVEDGALAGRRVVLDPFLPCRTRGLEPCPACARGQTALCERFGEGPFAPGMLLGYCRDLGGAWAEAMVAHRSQLHPVPDGVDDTTAVLGEPLAVALHAVLAAPAAGRVLVIGGGTIGLCVVAALALAGGGPEVVVVARHGHQQERARALGADAVVPSVAAAAALVERRGWGARHGGLFGTTAYTGGFDRVLDAVGSAESLQWALRLTRSGGRVDLLGASGVLPRLDLTWAWAHELDVQGFCGYGAEPAAGGEHTIALALRLLSLRPDLPLARLVTHRFPLERHREALAAAFDHRRSGSIKVVFCCGSGGLTD